MQRRCWRSSEKYGYNNNPDHTQPSKALRTRLPPNNRSANFRASQVRTKYHNLVGENHADVPPNPPPSHDRRQDILTISVGAQVRQLWHSPAPEPWRVQACTCVATEQKENAPRRGIAPEKDHNTRAGRKASRYGNECVSWDPPES